MDIKKILKENILFEEFKTTGELGGDIDEALISLGNKIYPKDGNAVIFAGGSGSGKSFVKDNLLGIEGKVLDADKLKMLYMKSLKLKNGLKNDYGLDIDNFDFKNPADVEQLHNILSTKGIADSELETIMYQISEVVRKPNIIFDTTLSSVTKFYNLATKVRDIGYPNDHIHLIWVLTDFETAFANNSNRGRVVPEIVFNDIHKGVSRTMKEILSMSNLGDMMDGDIYLVFNNPKNDTVVNKSNTGGKYVVSANYIKIKEAGRPLKGLDSINKEIIDKINAYVHSDTKW